MNVRRITGVVCVFAVLGIELGITSCSDSADLGGSGGGGKTSGTATGGGSLPGDGGPDDATVVGQVDGGVDTALPPLPELTNVIGVEREDSVGIDFDPVDGAIDYRVYPLPKDSDITVNDDGSVKIKDAIYRCAGLRQTFDLPTNLNSVDNGGGVEPTPDTTLAFYGQYAWGAQVPSSPTLGHVYVVPGSGRVPVYAIGVHPTSHESGWRETRPKIYTTDAHERSKLLGQGGRDDGIVFYVPKTASADTATIYHSENAVPVAGQDWTQYTEYYLAKADIAAHSDDTTPPKAAFEVLSGAVKDTKPLMTVLYEAPQQHVELAVGKERWKRAANQGQSPLWHVEWAGITEPTTLVVEALASGCPFQGLLSPKSLKAPPHQRFFTLAELQQASKTGEVFINGQYDLPGSIDDGLALLETPNASPVPIARSFVKVTPQPHEPSEWDWYEGFKVGSTFGTVTQTSDPKFDNDQWSIHYTSPIFDIGAYSMDKPDGVMVFTFGQFQGQFWDAFDDTGQDVTGRVLFTAKKKAKVDSDATKFLHVTWSVDIVGTDRRYPQLIVTDQSSPIADGFENPNANVLLIQTIQGPSMELEVEAFHGLVNGSPWAVNNQAPEHALIDYDNWDNGTSSNGTIPPAQPIFEHAGVDEMVKYDAYISNARLYVFVNGEPAACMKYPNGDFALSGPVTVTFGDVLYHEGAPDEMVCSQPRPFAFLHEHQCTETKRHWDDLGFKSDVEAPAWDYDKFPCSAY